MNGKSILVIDDDMSVLESIDFILTSEGYVVFLAANGEDGLNFVKNQHIDIVILDLKMPKVSGYVFANLVNQQSINKDIKIMVLTGQSLLAGSCHLTLPNVVSKMSKPFDIEELKQNVLSLVAA